MTHHRVINETWHTCRLFCCFHKTDNLYDLLFACQYTEFVKRKTFICNRRNFGPIFPIKPNISDHVALPQPPLPNPSKTKHQNVIKRSLTESEWLQAHSSLIFKLLSGYITKNAVFNYIRINRQLFLRLTYVICILLRCYNWNKQKSFVSYIRVNNPRHDQTKTIFKSCCRITMQVSTETVKMLIQYS